MSTSRRAWLVWSVGASAYVVAVLQRTSLGVSGLDAAHRFDITASTLASFAVLQLLVYAGLQVPVGLMLDRFGPRVLIASGASLMALGQVLLAVSPGVGLAVLGRVLVGAGDAMTFISVLRLVSAWQPPRRVAIMTQSTGLVGQLGQILSAVPLVALLHGPGWTTAFLSAAALSIVVGILVVLVVRDSPSGPLRRHDALTMSQVGHDLRSAWQHPGTRLGLWTHFTTQFSGTVFALLWGFPFLISGERLSHGTASALFTLFVVVGMAAAPFIGVMVSRHPLRRSWLVLGIVALNAGMWTVVLSWPGQAPLSLLALLVVSLALGGPGSMIGFDFARTFNPPNRLGTATGIVNVGGFFASLVTMFLVGLLLDAQQSGSSADYSLDEFRVAFSVQYVIWGIGLAGIITTRRKARARLARDEGVVVPPIREVIARRRHRP
jgi:sugar phosphate permease